MGRLRTNPRGWTWCGVVAGLGLLLTTCGVPHSEETKPKSSGTKSVEKEALTPFQDLVGGWRGTALPKRGSNTGGWIEKAEWRWKFDGDKVALEYAVDDGKLLKSGWMTFDPKTKNLRLKTVELGSKKDETIEREYTGVSEGNKLIFDTPAKEGAEGRRITVTRLNEKRTLVLFEQKGAGQNFFNRVAEVGYTREGTRLAESDQTGPVCVVTGGVGTIRVTYKGETYWVCCTGCRDAFNDDPEEVLADYRKKLEEKKNEKK
jgi:YHS domain-containing protein